jgi:hypothetical protein
MSKSRPPIPDPSVVLEVIRLADACSAARRARYGDGPIIFNASQMDLLEHLPEEDALFHYLKPLSDECLAGLYALYRLAECPRGTARSYARYYANVYFTVNRPQHHPHAAYDLAAKGPLAHGLRRGLERLWLGAGPAKTEEPGRGLSINQGRFVR